MSNPKEPEHKPSNKTLAIRGVFWIASTRFISIVVTFFVTPILFRALGAEQYGIWSIVMALTGYYGLVNMGIGKANTKYIAQFDALEDEQTVHRIISTGLAIYSVMALIVMCVAAVIAWWFPALFDIGDYPVHLARWVVMLTAAKVAAELVGQVFQAGLAARKRFDLINALVIAQLVLTGALTITVMILGGGLFDLAVVILGVGLLSQAVICCLAIAVGLPRPSKTAISRKTGGMLFRFGLLNLIIQFVRRFSLFGGSVVLGIVVGPAAVAFYSVAESLTRRILYLGKSINSVVMPFASQFEAQSDRYALKRLLILPTRLLMTFGLLVTSILLLMGNSFLKLWISPDVAVSAFPIVSVLSLSLLVKMPTNGIHSILEGMGKMTFLSRVAVGEGIVMLVLAVIFTPTWGAIGMAWAVLIAQVLVSGILLPVYVCKQLKLSTFRFGFSCTVPAILSIIPALLLAIYFKQFVPVDSLLLLLLQMGVVTVVTGLTAFWFCFDSDIRASIIAAMIFRRSSSVNPPLVTSDTEQA